MPHPAPSNEATARLQSAMKAIEPHVQPRPPSFCTGCPERPIFTAMKLVERELGPHHVSCDIGCHLFSILPPFNIGATTMGYGLGGAGASAFNTKTDKRAIAIMGDGGFWHNGLTSRHRQCRVQQIEQRAHHRRQRLYGGDRRTGHPVLHRQQPDPLDQEPDRARGARRRRQMGAHAHAHLRRRQDARHPARGADDLGGRAEGHRRPVANACSTSSGAYARCSRRRSRTASAWCASASESIPTPAPAIIPASGSRAARR